MRIQTFVGSYYMLITPRKIRRIIFEAVTKWDGPTGYKHLSVSQVKQIAGRAGRFGMQGIDEKPGGFVTTLRPEDLPFLRKTVAMTVPPLPYARLSPTKDLFRNLSSLLPPNSKTETIWLSSVHAGNIPTCYRHGTLSQLSEMCGYIDERGQFTLADRHLFLQAPFPWRDRFALNAVTEFLTAYYESMHVDVVETVKKLSLLEMLERAEQAMQSPDGRTADGRPFAVGKQLQGLEIFHKILVVYIWLSFRNPVSYPSHQEATELKERLERVLHWCLQEMTYYHGVRPAPVKPNRLHIDFKSKRALALEVQAEQLEH